ncbi:MAG: DUF4249 domain-containing protein [Tannerellaceae bacterium]|jgi:hypothetical protein|nr:DUF4249 domain-containing protein [Tannerellaceae bacterium]
MKKIPDLITVSFLLSAMSGCGEALMDYSVDTGTPVVESYLQEGASALSVKVYSMEVYLKDDYKLSKPISGLQVNVNGRELAETSSGAYSLDLGSDTIRENQQYALQFEYNNKSVEAVATVPSPVRNLRVEPESLEITTSGYFWNDSDTTEVIVTWDDAGDGYYQVYIESPNTSDMPSLGIFGQRMMQPFRGNTHRATARDFRSAGVHWIYVYRVNKDYVDLYERISSSDLANPVSSIHNAFGIFTSLSVARVRVSAYESSE